MTPDRMLEKMHDLIESMVVSMPDESLSALLEEVEKLAERISDEILRRRWAE